MFEILPELFMSFARAGGGGSGGSSGGGGGDLIALIGYVPSYYLGKLIKRFLPRKAELAVSISCATIISIVLFVLAAQFHGGFIFMFLIVAGIWSGWYAAFFGAWEKIKKRAKATQKSLDQAAEIDPLWDKPALEERVKNVFLQYQQDWSTKNVEGIREYTTHLMYIRSHFLLYALHQMHRENTISAAEILGMEFIFVKDSSDNNLDAFKVAIRAKAHDVLKDVRTSKTLFTDDREFIEYWTFIRSGDVWLLDTIDQETEDKSKGNVTIRQFAENNAFQYSPDMGWLLLPNKGVLFKGGKFGISDINNHIIGMFGSQLVQLYHYSEVDKPTAYSKTSNQSNMVVAQINLPKSYDGIIIKPRQSLFASLLNTATPNGYSKYTFEWSDFNKRYTVLATNQDRLATFELLNPGFMAYLYDTDPGVSIEVADNVVYLYKKANSGVKQNLLPQDFETLFTILEKAHKELKL